MAASDDSAGAAEARGVGGAGGGARPPAARASTSPTGAARAGHLAALAVLGAACWFAWLGNDTTYQVDPATGVASGPYEAWQVLGCVLSLAVAVVLGTVRLGGPTTVVVTTLAFTVAWSVTASADESGLWLVGALLVLVGVAVGASGVAAVTAAVLRRRRARVA
ncbi:hypothetical protein [Cellulomonas cellasea]|uniref:Uncharacterized protein n=1 Tax=Cellulomonas cellasea TaxID=43670 RepID=A0A7W4YEB8_9CELL|nr:hypothetical protein [Cellulomonas cellasea]MBB2925436.1 hypothetical protein [Cellulomonas cellasea]